ncbi:hypothetical protein [Yoonia maritima]|uniref:hypothetical protein n=1 Tax=Yoonia maritima TaxID=1435347 RepID=UPI00373602E9
MFTPQIYRRPFPTGFHLRSTLGDLISIGDRMHMAGNPLCYKWPEIKMILYGFSALTRQTDKLRLVDFLVEFPENLATLNAAARGRLTDPIAYASNRYSVRALLLSLGCPEDTWATLAGEAERAIGLQAFDATLWPLILASKCERLHPFDLNTNNVGRLFSKYCHDEISYSHLSIAVSALNHVLADPELRVLSLLPDKEIEVPAISGD